MGMLLDKGISILNRYRQPHPGHHRQVDQIVAHERHLFGSQPDPNQQAVERRQLIRHSQIGVADAEIGHPPLHRSGMATRDDGHFHSSFEEHFDPVSVANMECFVFIAVVAEIQAAIGQQDVYKRQTSSNSPCTTVEASRPCR